MKQIFTNLTYTLLATSLLCACSSESDPVTATSETNPNAISFTSYVGDMTRQSSEVPLALRTLQQDGFKVFAHRTAIDWATNGATSQSDFMYDQTVVFNPDLSAWSYSPAKLWPKTDKVSFFAYSPYDSQVSTSMPSPWNVPGAARLDYTHNGRIGSQDDLLAAASLDYTKTKHNGSVSFNFYHTLSKLKFAYSTETIAETTTVEVSKLALQYVDGAILNQRRLNLSGVGASMTSAIWSDTGSESYYVGDACQAGSVLNGESVLLIPQTYEDGELELVVSYKLTTNDPALPEPIVDEVIDRVIELPAIQGGLQPNKQYLYTLEIKPNAIKISNDIQVGAWGDASSHVVADKKAEGIYYNSEDNAFHITSGNGLATFAAIVNGTNKLDIDGFTSSTPNDMVHARGVLDNDIDLSTVCGSEKGSWTPIGDYGAVEKAYIGSFDGKNHYVQNLYIDNPSTDYQGLFGFLGNSGKLTHVKMRGAHVVGKHSTGALVGRTYGAEIQHCTVETGGLRPSLIQGEENVGGLAGYLFYTQTTHSRVEVEDQTLTVQSSGTSAGGFSGHIEARTVTNCTVVVQGSAQLSIDAGSSAGGFTGKAIGVTLVGCSSAVTSVTSHGSTGYFIGAANSTSHSLGCWAYSQTDVASSHLIGNSTGYIHNSKHGGSQITDIDALNSDIIEYNKTADADKQANYFNVLDTYGPVYDPAQPAYEAPAGIYYENNTFHITDAKGLAVFSAIINSSNTELVKGFSATDIPRGEAYDGVLDNDIDLSSVCNATDGNWTPVGSGGHSFRGTFDGQNHYIDNLYINSSMNCSALFGTVENGTVKNVKQRGVSIVGSYFVGALVGCSSYATIGNCYLEVDAQHPATLTGEMGVGGLCGWVVSSKVIQCGIHTDAPMTVTAADNYVGGFIGTANPSELTACTVSVTSHGRLDISTSNQCAGGFIGFGWGTFIDCGVSTVHVGNNPISVEATNGYVGGFAGDISSFTAVGCYSAVSDLTGPNEGLAIGKIRSSSDFYGCWFYCKDNPSVIHFAYEGQDKAHLHNSDFSSQPVTDITLLNDEILNYNDTHSGYDSNIFNTLGTYGPLRVVQ